MTTASNFDLMHSCNSSLVNHSFVLDNVTLFPRHPQFWTSPPDTHTWLCDGPAMHVIHTN